MAKAVARVNKPMPPTAQRQPMVTAAVGITAPDKNTANCTPDCFTPVTEP